MTLRYRVLPRAPQGFQIRRTSGCVSWIEEGTQGALALVQLALANVRGWQTDSVTRVEKSGWRQGSVPKLHNHSYKKVIFWTYSS